MDEAERLAANAARMREYRPAYEAALRERIFAALGDKCVRCGYSDKRALEFDHIDGGGSEHRRKAQNNSAYLRSILRCLDQFQVLCRNCNWIEYLESKEKVEFHPEVEVFLASVRSSPVA